MIIDEEVVKKLNSQPGSPKAQYIARCQKLLLNNLLNPTPGERLLYAGLSSADALSILISEGSSDTTVLVPARCLVESVRERLGERVDIQVGEVCDMPFSDNDFDLVVLSSALELIPNPGQAITEAIRVCRHRVFIGVINSWTPLPTKEILQTLFPGPLHRRTRFYSPGQLLMMIRQHLSAVKVDWGSQIFFPSSLFKFTAGLEKCVPMNRNPLGVYLGVSFPVLYSYRTIQEIIRHPFEIKKDAGQPAQGMVKEQKR